MSLKYFIYIFFLFPLKAQTLFIHPHYSNRIIDNQYEWALTHKAAQNLRDLLAQTGHFNSLVVTPLSYNKLSDFEKISFINMQRPTLCLIISLYQHPFPIPTIRLYHPYYETNKIGESTTPSLSFIPYQYGYKKNYLSTCSFIQQWYTLLCSVSTLKMLPFKKGPLKMALGIDSLCIFLEIGIGRLEDIDIILPTLADTLSSLYLDGNL